MIKLKCLNCGLTVRREGTGGDVCPRCLRRENRAVQLINVSDQQSSPSAASIGRLTIQTKSRGGSYAVVLEGELDISSAQMFESTLADICASAPGEITVDMGRVEFVDSSGFNAILRAKVLCEKHNCEFSLTPAQRPVQRAFETTRLLDKLPFRRAPEARKAPEARG
jgi:anti-sigma B factor antagonist